MIIPEQEKQITEYLISKKLHSQLLSEIKDHFLLQIDDIMLQDNLGFQEAFLQTKVNWQNELAMVKADVLSFKRITRIEKNILKPRFRNIALSSLVSSMLLGILIPKEIFMEILMLFAVLLTLLVRYNLVSGKMKLKDYWQLGFHPLMFKNTLLGIVVYSVIVIFNKNEFWDTEFFRFFTLYTAIIQIQLLYFNLRKVNVLVQTT